MARSYGQIAVDWPALVADLVEHYEREIYLREVQARYDAWWAGYDACAAEADARLRAFADGAVQMAQVAEVRARPKPPAKTAAQIAASTAHSWRVFERQHKGGAVA